MASLRALECLVAVADTGSITGAARLLHSSQPAVSHQLAVLEKETRTPLLRREARGVRLTPAGRAALTDARRAVDAAGAAVRSARAVGDGSHGSVRLASAQSLTLALLAPVIRDWRRRRPQVAISLRESADPDELLGVIDADEADLVLMPGPVDPRYTSVDIAEEEIVLSAPTGHRLAAKASVSRRDLDGEALVGFAADNGLGEWLDRSLVDAGVQMDVVMRTTVTSAAPQLAAAGFGVSVTPVSAVGAGLPGAVRSFTPRWTRCLVAVTPSGPPDPLVERFVDNLQRRGVRVPADIAAQLGSRRPDRATRTQAPGPGAGPGSR